VFVLTAGSASADDAPTVLHIRLEKLDITDPKSVNALGERLGDTPIDVLLNNAGVLGREPEQTLGTLDPDRFDYYMRTNALGALLVSERLLPNVKASAQKKILGISALVASFAAYPRIHPGLYYYKASKVALNMILRNIALDTETDGVAVAVLSPGVVNTYGTEMSPDMPGLVDIDTSVDGMMRVIDDLTIEGSGEWYRYTGQLIDW
jgi:NAD(P)-dependent dehydrogenase (short-subunit alcohol dehydrogenase family)